VEVGGAQLGSAASRAAFPFSSGVIRGTAKHNNSHLAEHSHQTTMPASLLVIFLGNLPMYSWFLGGVEKLESTSRTRECDPSSLSFSF
jgi:hypothetical protein